MIKTPLSTVIGGAGIWTPGCTVLGSMQKTLDQLIKSMFANNEQGFAYDPNDLTTMFQDAAGTIPVTGAGQPVGLMLDKSKGLTLGSELFIDSSVILTFQSTRISAGYYNISSTADTSAVHPSIAGCTKWRVVEYEITRVGSGSIRIDYAVGVNIVLPSTLGRRKLYIYGDRVNFVRNIMPTDIDFKIYSIKELAGNHAYQTVSASRPILQRNATTGAYYLVFDGADDFLVTNNIDFTTTDKVSLFVGIKSVLTLETYQVVMELSASVATNNGAFVLTSPHGGTGIISYTSKGNVRSDNIISAIPVAERVISAQSVISSDTNKVKVNNVLQISSTDQGTGNYGNYPLYIGRRAGTSLPFSGHIYSLISIGRLTTDAETINLEKSIAKNTGVTLSV